MSRYDGLEVLENASKHGGYTQVSNYGFMFMYRVAKAGIVSLERTTLLMDMLTFKHGEENPFTAQAEFARRFDCSVKVIKEAVKDLKTSGLLNIGKKGRKNSYDLSPYLKCLASFVELFQAGKDICIKRLIEDVLSGVYVPQMIKEKEQPVEPVFDEVITAALNKLTDAERNEAIPIVQSHMNRLSSESIEFYIEVSIGKERFGGYLNKCMTDGSDEDVRKRKEEAANRSKPKPKQNFGKNKTGRTELNPDWLKEEKDEALQEQQKFFDNTYSVYSQDRYKDIHNEEAFKHQGSFVAWYKQEVMNHGSKESFEAWCLEEGRRKMMELIGRKQA